VSTVIAAVVLWLSGLFLWSIWPAEGSRILSRKNAKTQSKGAKAY